MPLSVMDQEQFQCCLCVSVEIFCGICGVESRGWVQRVGWRRGGASTVQDEAVGLLHGTRADGDSQPCIPPQKIEDFYLKRPFR
jgi:hypothetical protein